MVALVDSMSTEGKATNLKQNMKLRTEILFVNQLLRMRAATAKRDITGAITSRTEASLCELDFDEKCKRGWPRLINESCRWKKERRERRLLLLSRFSILENGPDEYIVMTDAAMVRMAGVGHEKAEEGGSDNKELSMQKRKKKTASTIKELLSRFSIFANGEWLVRDKDNIMVMVDARW
jgi:hypothetical protein